MDWNNAIPEFNIENLKEKAIREAKEMAKKTNSSLPLSEYDKKVMHQNKSQNEFFENPPKYGGYTTKTEFEEKQNFNSQPETVIEKEDNKGFLGGFLNGFLDNISSEDIILFAIAFMLFKENKDNDLLLAVLFLIFSN